MNTYILYILYYIYTLYIHYILYMSIYGLYCINMDYIRMDYKIFVLQKKERLIPFDMFHVGLFLTALIPAGFMRDILP